MRTKAHLLISLLIASSPVLAEQNLLGNAGKTLLKDTATSAIPKEAVEGAEATSQKLKSANKLKGSVENAPDALKDQAQNMATEAAKKEMNKAVPKEAKQGLKTIESGAKTAKKMEGMIPKSSGEVSNALKDKAQEEAAKKAFDMMK